MKIEFNGAEALVLWDRLCEVESIVIDKYDYELEKIDEMPSWFYIGGGDSHTFSLDSKAKHTKMIAFFKKVESGKWKPNAKTIASHKSLVIEEKAKEWKALSRAEQQSKLDSVKAQYPNGLEALKKIIPTYLDWLMDKLNAENRDFPGKDIVLNNIVTTIRSIHISIPSIEHKEAMGIVDNEYDFFCALFNTIETTHWEKRLKREAVESGGTYHSYTIKKNGEVVETT